MRARPCARFVSDSPFSRAMSGAPTVVYTPQGPTLWTSARDRSTFSRRGSFSNGETMSRNSLVSLLSAALLSCGLPALAQKSSSGDKGKELVDAHGTCGYALPARVVSGCEPQGWRTAVGLMANRGAALREAETGPRTDSRTKA